MEAEQRDAFFTVGILQIIISVQDKYRSCAGCRRSSLLPIAAGGNIAFVFIHVKSAAVKILGIVFLGGLFYTGLNGTAGVSGRVVVICRQRVNTGQRDTAGIVERYV